MEAQEIIFDYVFIGIGASNSLLLINMDREGLLENKKVGIFDPSTKSDNDKTYCFWATKDEAIVNDLREIISTKYEKTIVYNNTVDIEAQPYYLIKSIDLYNYVRKIIFQKKYHLITSNIESVESKDDFLTLSAGNQKFHAKQVFDSRPLQTKLLRKGDITIHQTFYGLRVILLESNLNNEAFEMMDFEIDQHDSTQFVYTLPYSKQEALFEITRFGSEKIDLGYAKNELKLYIEKKYGVFEILEEEVGCIPMTTYKHEASSLSNLLRTGTSANLIKPSTGYGFKNMFYFAQEVVDDLKKSGRQNIHFVENKTKARFKFYDHLLLVILFKWPKWGKKIFTTLLKKQDFNTILTFLDEKTTVKEEVKIFAQLPLIPFFKALATYIGFYFQKRHLIVLGLLLLSVIIFKIEPTFGEHFLFALMLIGLISVGIPHGAVDHILLEKYNFNLLKFIAQYVSIIVGYFILWQLFPFLSLVLFILYSAFHFGESELMSSQLNLSKIKIKLSSFLIGICILGFIIFSHIEVAIKLLSSLNGLEFLNDYSISFQNSKPTVLALSFGFLVLIALWIKQINLYFLLLILAVGSYLPLLFHFGLYFIGQHSINAWEHIKERKVLKNKSLYLKAAPFSIAAFSFLLIYFFVLMRFSGAEFLTVHFFVFLACISLPHVVLMHLFYKQAS